jgi:hypothetical protein
MYSLLCLNSFIYHNLFKGYSCYCMYKTLIAEYLFIVWIYQFCLSIHQLVDIWVGSTLCLWFLLFPSVSRPLWDKGEKAVNCPTVFGLELWTLCTDFCVYRFAFIFSSYRPGSKNFGSYDNSMIFRNCLFSKAVEPFYIPTSSLLLLSVRSSLCIWGINTLLNI